MYGLISLGVALLAAFLFLVLWPVLIYLKDSNGLRKYPALTPFSGISNLPYMILSAQGHRSEHLAELHKEHPIIRIGPNALSFGKARAIKVSQESMLNYAYHQEPLTYFLGNLRAWHKMYQR